MFSLRVHDFTNLGLFAKFKILDMISILLKWDGGGEGLRFSSKAVGTIKVYVTLLYT